MPAQRKASFLAFFLKWAELQGWTVPEFHARVCHWLEHRGEHAVLEVFRGAAKSTILAVYNAWRYYKDPKYRILHQGDQDKTAYKTSRDTRAVLRRHPWTKHLAILRGEIEFWWVPGAVDERNPSMQAAGILSNITSSRAEEVQNDDVEVPKNIKTPDAREQLRYRLGEQTHILVPGGRLLYVGTPHTHDSIYDEEAKGGADVLKIPLFQREARFEDTALAKEYQLDFRPEYVFAGIGTYAKALTEGRGYRVQRAGKRWQIVFPKAPGTVIDAYAGCTWPERFTAAEMTKRRRRCKTLNAWDSQYQLHAKPVTQIRLDPNKLRAYEIEPTIRRANNSAGMWLGSVQIVSMSARWDPSGGKPKSDVSAFAVLLHDAMGRKYLHRCAALTGEVAAFADDEKTIIGGQVMQITELVRELAIPRVSVETNGIGQFAPAILRACLKQQRLICAVSEVENTVSKNKRVLEALESPLSARVLWAHADVLNGPLWDQMLDWNPAISDQEDDYVDVFAGCVEESPERIGKIAPSREMYGKPNTNRAEDWRPSGGVYEATLDLS